MTLLRTVRGGKPSAKRRPARRVQAKARRRTPYPGRTSDVSPAPAGTIQAKLTVGPPNDRFEQEADRVADQVMRMPDAAVAAGGGTGDPPAAGLPAPPAAQRVCAECAEEETVQRKCAEYAEEESVQRKCAECAEEDEAVQRKCAACSAEEETVRRQTAAPTPEVTPPIRSDLTRARRHGGRPLPAPARAFLEPRFGRDFSGVRVHTDDRAARLSRDLGARAFTVGNDVFFARGQFRPQASSGLKLLAHELTHTLQQSAPATAGASPGAAHGDPAVSGTSNRLQRTVRARGSAGTPASAPVAATLSGISAPAAARPGSSFVASPIFSAGRAEVDWRLLPTSSDRSDVEKMQVSGDASVRITVAPGARVNNVIHLAASLGDGGDEVSVAVLVTREVPETLSKCGSRPPSRLVQGATRRIINVGDAFMTERAQGESPIFLNGKAVLGDFAPRGGAQPEAAAREAIHTATLSRRTENGRTISKIGRVGLPNLGSSLIVTATPGPWRATVLPAKTWLGGRQGFDVCKGRSGSLKQVDVLGSPTSAASGQRVIEHEKHHVDDHRRAFDAIVAQWDDAVAAACRDGLEGEGADPLSADKDLFAKIGETYGVEFDFPEAVPIGSLGTGFKAADWAKLNDLGQVGVLFARIAAGLGQGFHFTEPDQRLGRVPASGPARFEAFDLLGSQGTFPVSKAERQRVVDSYPKTPGAPCDRVILGFV